jgi:hypothetical protein
MMRTLALLAAFLLGAAELSAQVVRYGIMTEGARAALERAWSDDPRQTERAYCVRRARITGEPVRAGAVDSIIRVLEVRPARVEEAGPNYARFECAPGTPELHTHAPATCPTDDPQWCTAGGPDAYSCQPSRGDYEKLARRGDPFGVIQCARQVFRFYYPSEFAGAGAATASGVTRRPDG